MPIRPDLSALRPHPPLIGFLTDYGHRDGFVAVCHGVIARIAPDARVIDVSHDVPAQDVRHGSIVLARAARRFPMATWIGVVDPGVGTERRGIVIRTPGGTLVGPDNGLLIPAADVLGRPREAYTLTNPDWWEPEYDRTFDGRDVFAPVAARLAAGEPLAEAGDPVDVGELVVLPEPSVDRDPRTGDLTLEVRYVDGFGNVQLAPLAEDTLPDPGTDIGVRPLGHPDRVARATAGVTFGDVEPGALVLYADSDRRLALAVNRGSATELLGVVGGDLLRLTLGAG